MDIGRDYRDALGRFPTGVALITLMADDRALAMTINSFSSVSLDPPLILWSVDHRSSRYEVFRDAPRFAINVLAADQESLSNACARDQNLENSGASWALGEGGAPLIEGCVARFECGLEALHPAGDHDIIVGRVSGFDMPRTAPALVFHRSGYEKAG